MLGQSLCTGTSTVYSSLYPAVSAGETTRVSLGRPAPPCVIGAVVPAGTAFAFGEVSRTPPSVSATSVSVSGTARESVR